MKKIILIIFILIAGVNLVKAQSTTTSFDVSGIKVIFKPGVKNIVNVRVYFRGGVTNYPGSKAGIETLALDATTHCGTKKYTADAYRDSTEKYGLGIFGSSNYDYGYIQLNCITKYFDKGWDLFTDAVNNPVFDAVQVAILKNKIIAGIKSYHSRAENNLRDIQYANAYANTAYAVNPIGTEETLSSLTADDLKTYYNNLLNKDRIFIVVVGNITKEELTEKILSSFDNIRSAPYAPVPLSAPDLQNNKLTSEMQNLKTDYVGVIMNAPDFTSPDYVPFSLAFAGLLGNLNSYLHSDKGISSDPGGGVAQLRMPNGVMYASSTDPKQVMNGMMAVLKYLQKNGYDNEWLQHIKNSYIVTNYINEQSAADITGALGVAEILGNWQYADDLPQLVNMVTVEQVNRVINLYIKGLRWSYLGNTDDISGYTPPVY